MPTDPTRPRRALDASGQLVAHPETKIARVPTGSAAPRAELGRACCPILIPRGGPRPWGSDPKIHDEQAGGNTRRSAAEPGLSSWVRAVSGGGFEGDLVAEGLELADVVAPGALSVDAGVVEAGAQVLEPCGRVG